MKKSNGFVHVELLLVVTVIGVLALIGHFVSDRSSNKTSKINLTSSSSTPKSSNSTGSSSSSNIPSAQSTVPALNTQTKSSNSKGNSAPATSVPTNTGNKQSTPQSSQPPSSQQPSYYGLTGTVGTPTYVDNGSNSQECSFTVSAPYTTNGPGEVEVDIWVNTPAGSEGGGSTTHFSNGGAYIGTVSYSPYYPVSKSPDNTSLSVYAQIVAEASGLILDTSPTVIFQC